MLGTAGFRIQAVIVVDNDTFGIDVMDNAIFLGQHTGTGVAGDRAFHTGSDERLFSLKKRNGLTHHVRTHECTVGIIVFEERNQRGGDRNGLARADVHAGDIVS